MAKIYDEIIPDIILVPVGGGGLISGIGEYSKTINKNIDSTSFEDFINDK